jgi:PPOX class probable F420-dependent enzyme
MPSDLAAVRELAAAEHGLATITTTRPDGTVHASIVNAGVIEDPVTGKVSIGFVARGGTRKLELFRRNGHATIVFRRGWSWVAVQGATHIVGPDDADPDFDDAKLPELLREVFKAATGTHDDWDEYDRVMAEDRRAAVFIEVSRLSGNS